MIKMIKLKKVLCAQWIVWIFLIKKRAIEYETLKPSVHREHNKEYRLPMSFIYFTMHSMAELNAIVACSAGCIIPYPYPY